MTSHGDQDRPPRQDGRNHPVEESEHEHEGLGLCGVGVYRGGEAIISRAGPGAVLLIVKTTEGNLAVRSAEIGVLTAVGWTGRDMRRQRLGETLVQSHLAGGGGIVIGYSMAYLVSLLDISVSAFRDMNPLPAFARQGGVAVQAVRLPVAVSARPTAAALGLSVAAGALVSVFMTRRPLWTTTPK